MNMNILNNIFSAECILNIAYQSVIILFLGWGILWLFKSKSAPMRSTVVLFTMVILLVLPLLNVSMSSLLHKSFGPTIAIKYEIPSTQLETLPLSSDLSEISNNNANSGLFWIQIINVFGILWGLGSLLFLFRFIYGVISLQNLKKSLRPVNSPRIEKILRESNSVFLRPIKTKIYESSIVRSPLVLGFFKPFILLPSESFKKMQQNDLRSILIHELSHIHHKDQMIGVLQRFITSLNWWNPLVHALSSTLSRTREEISDNHVLLKNNSKAYAECLVNLAEDKSFIKRFSVANAMASSHIPLKERVNHILSKERNMETRLKKATVCMLVLVSCVFLAVISNYRMTFAMEMENGKPARASEQEKQEEEEALVLEDSKIPKLIKRVEPIYPKEAIREGIKGEVKLQVTTDIYGRVAKVKIIKSIPELDDASVVAVKQWVYEPYIEEGKPISVAFNVTITFRLK